MTFNLEKLASLAKPQSEKEKEQARYRKENRDWLRMSQEIALCLHYYLRKAGLTQKELADTMGGIGSICRETPKRRGELDLGNHL